MTNVYANQKPKKRREKIGPRKETIDFLLNYSKALRIKERNGLECEVILN